MDDCFATWEVEKDIPANVIKEFEECAELEVERISTRSMGQTCNVLNVVKSDNTKPHLKKCKILSVQMMGKFVCADNVIGNLL